MNDIPLEQLGLKKAWPRLSELQLEVSDLTRRHREAQVEVKTLETKLEAARQADLDREAKAIRAGKEPPKAKHEPPITEQLHAAVRNRDVYARALEEAQRDLGAFHAKHRNALYRDVLQARQKIAREVAEHAQAAAAGFGRWSDMHYLLKDLAPPVDYEHDENAPPVRLGNHFLAVQTTQSGGPPRGQVEQMLAYLASLAPNEEGSSDAA